MTTAVADYDPPEWTNPDTLTHGVAEGWADPETDPTRIDWAARQQWALLPFPVVNGRPVNPHAVTGRRGRGDLGLWGENPMADAIVTTNLGRDVYLLLVERGDGHGWAIPGGSIDGAETPTEAAVRELAEETGLLVAECSCIEGAPCYVPDPRASDEAWAVTVPSRIYFDDRGYLPPVTGATDALRAGWFRANTIDGLVTDLAHRTGGQLFPAHLGLITKALILPALDDEDPLWTPF